MGLIACSRLGRRVQLLAAYIAGGVDDLPLQVRKIHDVEIHDAQRADAGGSQVQRQRRAQPAGADAQHLRLLQLELALHANFRQDQMARVAQDLLIAERSRRWRSVDFIANNLTHFDAGRLVISPPMSSIGLVTSICDKHHTPMCSSRYTTHRPDRCKKASRIVEIVNSQAGVGKGLILELASIGQSVSYEPGAHVLKEGEPGKGIYILRSGAAKVLMASHDGKTRELRELEPGSFIGLSSALSCDHCCYTVEATVAAEFTFVPAEAAQQLCAPGPIYACK